MKKMDSLGSKVWKNVGLKKSKNNKKEDQLDLKLISKLVQNDSKWSNDTFC